MVRIHGKTIVPNVADLTYGNSNASKAIVVKLKEMSFQQALRLNNSSKLYCLLLFVIDSHKILKHKQRIIIQCLIRMLEF